MFDCPACGHKTTGEQLRYCEKCGFRIKPTKVTSVYAGFNFRGSADFADVVIVFLVGFLVACYVFEDKTVPGWYFAVVLGGYLLLMTIMECSPMKASLGKGFQEILVTDLNFRRIGFFRSLLRNLCKLLTAVSMFGYFLPLLTPRRQGLHDLLAGTVLVTEEFFSSGYIEESVNDPEIPPSSAAKPRMKASPTDSSGSQERLVARSGSKQEPKPSPQSMVKKIDINSCTEEQLANLPGIGPVLAKKAVMRRAETGGFISLEGFGRFLGLQSHMIERLRPMVALDQGLETRMEETKREAEGRIIDV